MNNISYKSVIYEISMRINSKKIDKNSFIGLFWNIFLILLRIIV